MVVFNVPRAGRQGEDYTKNLIENMFDDESCVYKQGFGVCYNTPEMIVQSFESVRKTYCKANAIKTHYFELYVEYEIGLTAVEMVAEMIGKGLYNAGFQSFVTVSDTGDQFLIAVALNSTAFTGNGLFHDNNACYTEVYNFICTLLPKRIQVGVTENTFFDPSKREGNYCHGVYM